LPFRNIATAISQISVDKKPRKIAAFVFVVADRFVALTLLNNFFMSLTGN